MVDLVELTVSCRDQKSLDAGAGGEGRGGDVGLVHGEPGKKTKTDGLPPHEGGVQWLAQ